jgi:hypothetical protein
MPLLVAASWIFQGSFALDSEHDVSGKAVLAWVSFVAAGIGLGAAVAILNLRRPKRPRRTPGIQRSRASQPLFFLMFGLLQVSFGVDSVSGGAMAAHDWVSLISTSVIGGAFIGAALGLHQAKVDRFSTAQESAPARS